MNEMMFLFCFVFFVFLFSFPVRKSNLKNKKGRKRRRLNGEREKLEQERDEKRKNKKKDTTWWGENRASFRARLLATGLLLSRHRVNGEPRFAHLHSSNGLWHLVKLLLLLLLMGRNHFRGGLDPGLYWGAPSETVLAFKSKVPPKTLRRPLESVIPFEEEWNAFGN